MPVSILLCCVWLMSLADSSWKKPGGDGGDLGVVDLGERGSGAELRGGKGAAVLVRMYRMREE